MFDEAEFWKMLIHNPSSSFRTVCWSTDNEISQLTQNFYQAEEILKEIYLH